MLQEYEANPPKGDRGMDYFHLGETRDLPALRFSGDRQIYCGTDHRGTGRQSPPPRRVFLLLAGRGRSKKRQEVLYNHRVPTLPLRQTVCTSHRQSAT